MSSWVKNGRDALKMRCPLFSRKQTCIGRCPKVGFSDWQPEILRMKEDHRPGADKRQRFHHPPSLRSLDFKARQYASSDQFLQNVFQPGANTLYFGLRCPLLEIMIECFYDHRVHGAMSKAV
jgi:hypothetical protein